MLDLKLCIEPIPAESELNQKQLLVTEEERRTAASFGHERRRTEYLLWRHTVRRELGEDAEIAYSESGAPFIKNRNINIGISHSRDFVAVIVSPRRCAVDIESLARNFHQISSRYISEAESLLSDDPRLPAVLWCAKETLYKYAGRKELDLLRDIRIERVDFDRRTVTGRIGEGNPTELHILFYGEQLVVYIG